MKMYFAIAFFFIVLAILILLKINSESIKEASQLFKSKKVSLRKLATVKKKSRLSIFLKNIILALETMGQINKLYYIILLSFLLIIVGSFAGITIGNIYLSLVGGIILASLPFLFVRAQYVEYKALLLDEMETGLSVITSSIERTDNITSSILENLPHINKPLHDVFAQFLFSVNHNMPIADAIDNMKSKINNPIFVDWCDALKNVARNRTLKYSLRPIVQRINDVKIASAEAKTILFEANSEFKAVSIFSVIFMLVSYIVAPKMMESLGVTFKMNNVLNILLSIDILMLFFFSIRTFLLTRDINYEEE